MKEKVFLTQVSNKLQLGKIIEEPIQISGELTHRMFKLVTDKKEYIIKLLNHNIMKRKTALNNFNTANKYEELFKKNNISAVYSNIYNDKKLQQLDGQYFYVYDWYNGKVLYDKNITEFHCKEIGTILAKIHNIDFIEEKYEREEIHIDWNKYLKIAKEKNGEIYNLLKDKIDILNDSMKYGNIAMKKLPSVKSSLS